MKHTLKSILLGLAIGVLVVAIGLASGAALDRYRAHRDLNLINFELNEERQVVAEGIYRDGHITTEAVYETSTAQGSNPLADPFYAGNAATTSCYDPKQLFAAGKDTNLFAYNRGLEAGDCGWTRFDDNGEIMTVYFKNGVKSWVDADGVIASATMLNGEVFVAFYGQH